MSFNQNTEDYPDLDLFGLLAGSEAPARQLIYHAADHPLYRARSIQMPSDEEVAAALAKDAVSRKVLQKGLPLEEGKPYGVRLNLNIFKSHGGLAVQTVHQGNSSAGYKRNKGLYGGAVVSYLKVVQLTNCYFNVSQSGREKIASGRESKFPMASCDGELDLSSEVNFAGIEISFNPKKVRFFCDAENRPIRYAEFATVCGSRVYVRGRIEYYSAANAPEKVGHSPCQIQF